MRPFEPRGTPRTFYPAEVTLLRELRRLIRNYGAGVVRVYWDDVDAGLLRITSADRLELGLSRGEPWAKRWATHSEPRGGQYITP